MLGRNATKTVIPSPTQTWMWQHLHNPFGLHAKLGRISSSLFSGWPGPDDSFTTDPVSATKRYKHHLNKVTVMGLGRNSSYLAGFSIFLHGSTKKFGKDSFYPPPQPTPYLLNYAFPREMP